MSKLIDDDRQFVWHPFTQHETERDPISISGARNASLFKQEGGEILDLISSWWTCTHGHSHPKLNEALALQAETLEHVMFSGFTHSAAVDLARLLSDRLAGDLSRVFFSDNGSTAVEVALKISYQYWQNTGESRRKNFIAFDGGYHGDTLGAMSVGRGSGFFQLFEGLMCSVETVPFAETWDGDVDVASRESVALDRLSAVLQERRGTFAAMIVEPLMQGAGGMRFCRPEFIRSVVELVRSENVLVIFDEVATGFGRTGSLFAFEQTGVAPDLLCLSKGLTAGYMPMSVTVATEQIYSAFLGQSFARALAHGHSFTANPLACAVGLRSLRLFDEEDTLSRIGVISERHQNFLSALHEIDIVECPRVLGSVLACNLATGDGAYKSEESVLLRDWYLKHGFNIRPIGNALYLMPPYCITDEELSRAYQGVLDGLQYLSSRTP